MREVLSKVYLSKQDDLVERLRVTETSLVGSEAYGKEKSTEILVVTAEARSLREKLSDLSDRSKKLSDDIANRDETIDKLQLRCASLVAEKSEKTRLLETEKAERIKQTQEVRVRY